MPTTDFMISSVVNAVAELATWPFLVCLSVLVVITVGPRLHHAH